MSNVRVNALRIVFAKRPSAMDIHEWIDTVLTVTENQIEAIQLDGHQNCLFLKLVSSGPCEAILRRTNGQSTLFTADQERINVTIEQAFDNLKLLEAHEQQNKILLKNNAKAYESKLLNLQAQIGTISKENETLLEHLKSSASLVSELDGSVLEWSQRAEELREEVCLLRESNNKQEVLVSDCERDKQDYAEQLDECSSQVLHLAAELQSIKTERGELRKQLRTVEKHTRTAEQLEADLRCLQSDLTLASKTAQNQEKMIHLLTAEKAVVAENLVNMTSKIDRLELEVMSLRQTVNEQVNELDKAKDAINKAVKLENEVNNVGKELDAAKTTLAEQESVLARSEEEIKSFKSQCFRATHAQHVSGATQRVLTCPTSPRPLEETAEQLYAVTSHASEQLSMHTA